MHVDTYTCVFTLDCSKWTMLILARLLIIHSNLSYSVHAEKPHLDEARELYHKLAEVDPMHSHFYDEQLSQLLFEQVSHFKCIYYKNANNSVPDELL